MGKLDEYERKRRFESTPEPSGAKAPRGRRKLPRFVVQEHHARRLHWDFRLERDGVLLSWACPKGIPLDPKTNHLAVHVEDHPLDYIDFEGTIPAGNYGAGSVRIWDSGTYEELKFRDDEVMVVLHGNRLEGKYVLFQTDGKNWIIHRMDPPSEPAPEGPVNVKSNANTSVEVRIEDRILKLTNLDKVLYPDCGFTKAQVIDYYTRIAPVLLPHLQGRALTLKRYPNGVDEQFFYEKNCPKHRPEWFRTARIWSGGNNRYMHYCVVDDLPSLVWVANLATLELHTSLAPGDSIEYPRCLVFDLDPGPPATIVECAEVGLRLRALFADHGLECFAKTSGSKGLQLYVPLNQSEITYNETKRVAHAIAKRMAEERPERVVALMSRELRKGRVFIDWSQNDQSKTTINVYSLRARAGPTISTPLSWDEVEEIRAGGNPERVVFESDQVLERVASRGDLFEPVLSLKQELPPDLLDGAPALKRRSGSRRGRQSGLREEQPNEDDGVPSGS